MDFSHKCLLLWVNFHVQANDKVVLKVFRVKSHVLCVICKQCKCWLWRKIAPMVKGIMGDGIVINSSFLCCNLISSREFHQDLSKQTWRLHSKGKPKVRPITVNIYSSITGHFQVSPFPPPPPLFFLPTPSFCPPFILSSSLPSAWFQQGILSGELSW